MTNSVSGERPRLAPEEDFVRHFAGSKIDGEKLLVGAFSIPPDHEGEMSVNRLRIFHTDTEADLAEIRARSTLKLRASGRFVRWNAGEFEVAAASSEVLKPLELFEDPLPPLGDWPGDPSHAVVTGVPSDTLAADLLLDLVRPTVKAVYAAKISGA